MQWNWTSTRLRSWKPSPVIPFIRERRKIPGAGILVAVIFGLLFWVGFIFLIMHFPT